MNLKNPRLLIILTLACAWLFDFLFYGKEPGISLMLFVLAAVAAGLALARSEGRRPALASLWLLLPIAFFSVFFWLRREPLTLFLNVALTLACLMLLALTLQGGRWTAYTLSDYAAGFFRLVGSALGRTATTWFNRRGALRDAQPVLETDGRVHVVESQPLSGAQLPEAETSVAEPADRETPTPSHTPLPAVKNRRSFAPVLRGLLLAFPIVTLLAALLAAADPVFEQSIAAFLDIFRIEKLAETLFRMFYILILAYILAGVYLHGMFSSSDEKLAHESNAGRGWLPQFLGYTEGMIVLAAVDLLFAAFVAVQFRYFFGGQANIRMEGFTYAEYARRGFGELVAVAFISLLLFQVLSAITRRRGEGQRWGFSALGVGLVVLIVVILVSAFQRLLLYEAAYGFTRQRGYTHIFIIWLGILLAATVTLEVAGRQRAFALAAVLAAFGFGASINLVNVDQLIVRHNLARAQAGAELDMAYLASLSDDSVPALVQALQNPALPEQIHGRVAGALTCQQALYRGSQDRQLLPTTWQSFNYASYRAAALLVGVENQLADYRPVLNNSTYEHNVTIAGEQIPCQDRTWMD